jgi:molecular chaperone GrpE
MEKSKQGKHSRKKMDGQSDEVISPVESIEGDSGAQSEFTDETGGEVVPLVQYEALQEQMEAIRIKSAENFEGWQRERADFINYKKRIERDQVLNGNQIKGEIIKNYLQILDDLELALKSKPEAGDGKNWAEGIELISRKLRSILESEGVKQIEAEQGYFDPNVHEAISNESDPNFKSGEIIEVLQRGYRFGDRVLRPAKVRVAR